MYTQVKIVNALSLILLHIILSACTGRIIASVPTIIQRNPNPITSGTETLPGPSATPQHSPTLTSTLQPSQTPTSTPRPTYTHSTSRKTALASLNNPATQTQRALDADITQIAGYRTTCNDIRDAVNFLSIRGNWLAIYCNDREDQTLEVMSKAGKHWILQFKDYLWREYKLEGSRGWLYPVYWTNDESYLFFTSEIAYLDGGGACFYDIGVHGLYRINLNNGTVSAILPATSSLDGYEFAFSPDGRRLAYIADQLTILDLKTGEKINILVEEASVGDLTWSPNGSHLAYSTCQTEEDVFVEKSSIKIYSLETQVSKTILEVKRDFLRIELWEGKDLLKIANRDFQSYLYFDWSSGQMFTPTPTPRQ